MAADEDLTAPEFLAGAPSASPNAGAASLDDSYAYCPMHNYAFVPNGDLWPAATVNQQVPTVHVSGSKKPIPAATWLDRNRFVQQVTWAPGEPQVIERGALPVFLKYFGATRTARWSGGDRANWQNFPRSGELRECISAPASERLVICDMAQIECRILNYVAGQWDTLDAFREGRDIYCEIPSDIYRRPIDPKKDKAERFFGKKIELSCGYGIGHVTLYKRLRGEKVKVKSNANAPLTSTGTGIPRCFAFGGKPGWCSDG